VDVDVGIGVGERHDVRDLRSEMEDDVAVRDATAHLLFVPDIRREDLDLLAHLPDVGGVGAVTGDLRVADGDVRSLAREPNRKTRSDEAEASGDQNFLARPGHGKESKV